MGCELSAAGRSRLARKSVGEHDIVVIACVRNEALRLPWFLEYHRRLGVNRFLIIDNASEDETPALLDRQDDVVRFLGEGGYAKSNCGVDWTNEIASSFCTGRWVLTLDADELFYFPRCENRAISDLTRYLELHHANSFAAPLLDMYPSGPISLAHYRPGDDLLETFPYFDATGYDTVSIGGLDFISRGGPRKRVFWDGQAREHPSPVLTKIPLVRWSADTHYQMSTHRLQGARLSGISGVLLHFKLAQDFARRAEEEAEREQHFAGARQYRAYADGARRDDSLSFLSDCSQRLTDSMELVKLRLMHMPSDY